MTPGPPAILHAVWLNGLGHVALHAGDDVGSGLAQFAKFVDLFGQGIGHRRPPRYWSSTATMSTCLASSLDQGQDLFLVVIVVAGAGLVFGGPGGLGPKGQRRDKGKGVAVVLPQQRLARILHVEAAAVDGNLIVPVEAQRAACAVAAKVVDVVAAQPDDVRADGLQRGRIVGVAAQDRDCLPCC